VLAGAGTALKQEFICKAYGGGQMFSFGGFFFLSRFSDEAEGVDQ